MPDDESPGTRPRFDAVVLAGGRGVRLGGPVKPEVVVAGRALLDHALAAVADARQVVVVGPPSVARSGIPTVLEDPPDGGPVAGLAAGLTALPADADLVVVLACDIPRAGRALPALLEAASAAGVDGARLLGADGFAQHLLAVYRRPSLDRALDRLGPAHGASMRTLLTDLVLVDVPDTDDAAADADTWPDVERLDAVLSREQACTAERIEP